MKYYITDKTADSVFNSIKKHIEPDKTYQINFVKCRIYEKSFHNSLNEKNTAVQERKAESQERLIINFMQDLQFNSFTPFEIHEYLFDAKTPVTSIRRALCNLENKGLLVKTGEMVPGKYGRVNYKWGVV